MPRVPRLVSAVPKRAPLPFVAFLAALSVACAWDPYIPPTPPPTRAISTPPAERIPLDTAWVDTLDCYSRRCQTRFRVVVDEPGQLTVQVLPELAGPDAQAKLVLESVTGVLGLAATPRGVSADVITLTVREPVDAGTYFILLQSLGGPMPYELSASLTPGEAPVERPLDPIVPETVLEGDRSLVEISGLRQGNRATYDAMVGFERARSFQFPSAPPAGAGASIDSPLDRRVRRFIASELQRKGIGQASGAGRADLIVDFETSSRARVYAALPFIYGAYEIQPPVAHFGSASNERYALTIDIIERETNRLAWHAEVTGPLGPEDDPSQLLRAAVTEALSSFPPR